MYKKLFGKYVKIHRNKLKITQEQLSTETGIPKKTISRVERGLGFPNLEQLIILSRVLNMSIDQFICGINKYGELITDSEINNIILSVPEEYRKYLVSILKETAEVINLLNRNIKQDK